VHIFDYFQIDGDLLLALEWSDLEDLGIKSSVEIKRVMLEYRRTMMKVDKHFFRTFEPTPEAQTRRVRLRKHFQLSRAASKIQKVFRGRAAADRVRYFKTLVRVEMAQEKREKEIETGKVWWHKRPDASEYKGPYKYEVDPASSTTRAVKALPLKQFGKRQDLKTVRGWGKWETPQRRLPPPGSLETPKDLAPPLWCPIEMEDTHVSRKFDESMKKNIPRIKDHPSALHFSDHRCLSRRHVVVNPAKAAKAE